MAQIFTRGTHFNTQAASSTLDYDTKYVLAFCTIGNELERVPEVAEHGETEFGFCYFDMSTLKFYLGQFKDDFTFKRFRTLTLQTRPMEALCYSSTAKQHPVLKILQNSPNPPSFSYLSKKSIEDLGD